MTHCTHFNGLWWRTGGSTPLMLRCVICVCIICVDVSCVYLICVCDLCVWFVCDCQLQIAWELGYNGSGVTMAVIVEDADENNPGPWNDADCASVSCVLCVYCLVVICVSFDVCRSMCHSMCVILNVTLSVSRCVILMCVSLYACHLSTDISHYNHIRSTISPLNALPSTRNGTAGANVIEMKWWWRWWWWRKGNANCC